MTPSFVGSNPPTPDIFNRIMKTFITFSNDREESRLPFVKVTKSKNGETGTATFLFLYPLLFLQKNQKINLICLQWEKKTLCTNKLSVLFKKGSPFLLKAIFVFTKTEEWFAFLSFMNLYSKERGLSFHSDL